MALRLTACLLALLLSACASTGGQHSAAVPNRDLITADEITHSHESNAYTAIQALRPNMLAVHGPTSITNDDPGIVVFVNGQRYGDVNTLRDIAASEVLEIRFLSPGQAQYRYGAGYPEGIIEVKTKPQ